MLLIPLLAILSLFIFHLVYIVVFVLIFSLTFSDIFIIVLAGENFLHFCLFYGKIFVQDGEFSLLGEARASVLCLQTSEVSE